MNNKQRLIEALDLIKTMGIIIRTLDENNAHSEYWNNDGDYVPAAVELLPNENELPPQQHVIEITFLAETKAVVLRSYYFDQELYIPLNHDPGEITPAIETAKRYLEKQGQNIVGYCSSKKKEIYHIVLDTFLPLAVK